MYSTIFVSHTKKREVIVSVSTIIGNMVHYIRMYSVCRVYAR